MTQWSAERHAECRCAHLSAQWVAEELNKRCRYLPHGTLESGRPDHCRGTSSTFQRQVVAFALWFWALGKNSPCCFPWQEGIRTAQSGCSPQIMPVFYHSGACPHNTMAGDRDLALWVICSGKAAEMCSQCSTPSLRGLSLLLLPPWVGPPRSPEPKHKFSPCSYSPKPYLLQTPSPG